MASKKTDTKTEPQLSHDEVISKVNSTIVELTTTALTAPVASTTALAAPSLMDEFASDEESLTAGDLLLPRYLCVQKMTKACKNNKELKEGMFYAQLNGQFMSRALVVPILETHHIVEKKADNTSQFIQVLELNDKRVTKAVKANGNSYIKLMSTDVDPPTKFVETYDVHVVFLDEKDGITPLGFGVLSCHSANLMPRKIWKNDRNAVVHPETKKKLPTYAFRTIVTCEVKDNSKSNNADSMIFKFTPYQNNWLAGRLDEHKPAEIALLRQCMAHKALVESGVYKVDQSEAGDDVDDESAQEKNSFDPDDDGRESPPATKASGGVPAVNPDDF